jgi:hypothetical protein
MIINLFIFEWLISLYPALMCYNKGWYYLSIFYFFYDRYRSNYIFSFSYFLSVLYTFFCYSHKEWSTIFLFLVSLSIFQAKYKDYYNINNNNNNKEDELFDFMFNISYSFATGEMIRKI